MPVGVLLILQIAAWVLVAGLFLAGTVLSVASVSGTWLILVASVVLKLTPGLEFVTWVGCGVLLAICIVVEVLDTWASALGVKLTGGSRWTGLASVAGGLLGAVVGAMTPLALVTTPVGMIIGSFGAAYAVELHIHRQRDKAARVARGTALARVAVGLLKLVATLGMVAYILAAALVSR